MLPLRNRLGLNVPANNPLWTAQTVGGQILSNEFFGPPEAPPAGGLIKVWSGSAWEAKPAKVWGGLSWDIKPLKFWDGAQWATS